MCVRDMEGEFVLERERYIENRGQKKVEEDS